MHAPALLPRARSFDFAQDHPEPVEGVSFVEGHRSTRYHEGFMPVAHDALIQPTTSVRGALRVPGDKSISHRYALLAAIAEGSSTIANYAPGADCASTLACMAALGAAISRRSAPGAASTIAIDGRGARGLQAPPTALDCGNSGSTMRMLSGILAAQPFESVLFGDGSLSRRPMRRVMAPLAQMGAHLSAGPGERPPLTIRGGSLHGIRFTPEVPSAQVKSAVLLAGIHARGATTVVESSSTRDHTERAIAAFGGHVDVTDLQVTVTGGQRLIGQTLRVPGDLSSAAFPLIAAAAMPGSEVRIEHVGLNPSRAGLLALLRRLGADVDVAMTEEWHGEPVGHVVVRAGDPTSVAILPSEVPGLIDELPVLAAWATFGGEISVTGAGELRVKESDRITSLVEGLRALGADADELPDGFHVRGGRRLTGGTANARHDHRLAMAFAVAALGATGPSVIEGADVVQVSYPGFFEDLERLRT
jgi:3-phosphoshikimate 1-carboxyvinyltransferase